MELRHLRYFVAVAEEGSFTRAAERLWIAQPGLSTQIRRLEQELGIPLFERHTRGVNLTPAGAVFLERARVALAAAEAAQAAGRDLATGIVGTIRLGTATCAAFSGAADLLGCFAADRPGIETTVVASYGGTLLRDLRDARLDAVIAPAIYGSAELQAVRLGRRPWLVLAGAAHRLGRDAGPVAVGELQGERLVITGHRDAAAYDRAVADTLAELGVTCELRRAGAGPARFAPVTAGDALALTTSPEAAGAGLVTRQLAPVRAMEFALLWCDETPSPALDRLIRAAARGAATDGRPRSRRALRVA